MVENFFFKKIFFLSVKLLSVHFIFFLFCLLSMIICWGWINKILQRIVNLLDFTSIFNFIVRPLLRLKKKKQLEFRKKWTIKYVPQTNAIFPDSYHAYEFWDSYMAKFSSEETTENISQKEGRHSLVLENYSETMQDQTLSSLIKSKDH